MIERFEQFVTVISGIHRSIQKIERSEMVRYGLKGAYAQYFVALHRNPQGLTVTQLGEICDVNKAAVSRVVNELEEKRMVVREGDNPRGRIQLTPEGQSAAEDVVYKAATAARIAGETMDDEMRQTLYTALNRIGTRLQEIQRDGVPDHKETL